MTNIDQMPQLHTGSFLTNEQAEQFKEAFKNLTVVVRCKDCKHGRQYEPNAIDCEYRELATEPDWFCADGVAKDINAPGKEGW